MTLKKILPPKLASDKKIGVIAPADPVGGVCPKYIIRRGYKYLKDRGFSVVEGESVKKITKRHVAGSVQLRVADIHNFIKRNDIGCVMAFWGGFNTNQLLDYLDYDLIRNNPKIIIGYSDVTALTTAITVRTGLVTFSGPGVVSFIKPNPFPYTWEYFNKACINPENKIVVKASKEYADDLYFLRKDDDHRIIKKNKGTKVFKKGNASGEIVVGNLQTLLILNGTKYAPDLSKKILFVEEDETSTPAHVDRFICQCKQLGWFDKINGLVFGRFTEYSQFSKVDSFEDILKEYFSEAEFPILYNADFGHSDPMITIPNGGTCYIEGNKIILDKAVLNESN